MDLGLTLEQLWWRRGGSGRKEIRNLCALEQSKIKHRPFDCPPRWGFAQVLVVTLEEQEVPSCLSHLASSVRLSFLAWKSSRSGGSRSDRLGDLFPTLPGPRSRALSWMWMVAGNWGDYIPGFNCDGLPNACNPCLHTIIISQMPSLCQALGFTRIISFILRIIWGVGTMIISTFREELRLREATQVASGWVGVRTPLVKFIAYVHNECWVSVRQYEKSRHCKGNVVQWKVYICWGAQVLSSNTGCITRHVWPLTSPLLHWSLCFPTRQIRDCDQWSPWPLTWWDVLKSNKDLKKDGRGGCGHDFEEMSFLTRCNC